MRARRPIVVIGVLFLTGVSMLASTTLERADALFENGHFAEAESAYFDALRKNPKDLKANTVLGMIALFSNRLDDSEKYLRRAAQPGPLEALTKSLLGEVFYRRDDFAEAARWFRAAGSNYRAEPLELFGNAAPYAIEGPRDETRLKFVATDPLPIVEVRVNGSEPANFLIDTAGAEIQLDSNFAKQLQLTSVGGTSATLLDGSQTEMRHSRVASLRLGEFEVKNVLVGIRPLPVFAGRKLDGVLGTVLLYHFLATLDYPNGELILRRRSAEALRAIERRAELERQIVVPFWMASDHVIVARGRVNLAPPTLLIVATGFASGFTCPESAIEQAGVTFDRGGSLLPTAATTQVANLTPFVVDDLYLGEAQRQNVGGIAGAFPAAFEHAFGFRIGGMIAHQFFRTYAVTFDFTDMRIFLSGPPQPKPTNKSPIEVQTALLPR
jgi:tetratricopeptide (TPR) repeat protein